MFRIFAKSALLVGSLWCATGCVTNGKDFKSDTSWIRQNTTKKSDVQMMLGEPYSVGDNSGRPTWTYGYYRYKLVGKSMQKELKFTWNPDGTVSNYSFNSSFPDDTQGKAGAAKGPQGASEIE